jgi:chemotaxis protein CheC
MTEDNLKNIDSEEIEILQEIMNIAFGNATADLVSIIDLYVVLSVPVVKVLEIGALQSTMLECLDQFSKIKIIAQKFWGEFKGAGILIFPENADKNLSNLFNDTDKNSDITSMSTIMGNDVLLEIGNLLIGACVGKITELLKSVVTFSPPNIIGSNLNDHDSFIKTLNDKQRVILLKTVFEFEKKNVNGLLMILTNEESIAWLKNALNNFIAQY